MSVSNDVVKPFLQKFGRALGQGAGGELAKRAKNNVFRFWDQLVTQPVKKRTGLIVLSIPPDRSSRFNYILWDGEDMGVEFKDCTRIVYRCVPKKIYQDFVVASSLGKYFDDYIQGKYVKYDVIPPHMQSPNQRQRK